MTQERPPTRRQKPAVPATPRDVVHIRLGSFVLFFAIAFAVLGFISGIPLLAVVMSVIAVIAVIDIAVAIRRQSLRERRDADEGLE